MRDEYLKAGLQPANFVFTASRQRHPNSWSIRSVSPGYTDVYEAMAFADRERDYLSRMRRHLIHEGAVVAEFAILRPTWEEIEEIALSD